MFLSYFRMASTIIQVYLKQILESFICSNSQVRGAALGVIHLVLRQGLIHPVQVSAIVFFSLSDLGRGLQERFFSCVTAFHYYPAKPGFWIQSCFSLKPPRLSLSNYFFKPLHCSKLSCYTDVLIRGFWFSFLSCIIKVEKSYYLLIAVMRRDWFMLFPKVLAWGAMQTASSKIWTWLAVMMIIIIPPMLLPIHLYWYKIHTICSWLFHEMSRQTFTFFLLKLFSQSVNVIEQYFWLHPHSPEKMGKPE